MTITNSGLLAITFGITIALVLFIIAGIWACFQVVNHFTKEDDKFEYHIEETPFNYQTWQELGEEGWELIGFFTHYAYFIRRTKEKTEY